MSLNNRKSSLNLYVDTKNPLSLCLCIIKEEKDIPLEIVYDIENKIFKNTLIKSKITANELKDVMMQKHDDKQIANELTSLDKDHALTSDAILDIVCKDDMLLRTKYVKKYLQDIKISDLENHITQSYPTLPCLSLGNELKTIVDFEVIFEYLENRFPHPPLLPVYQMSVINLDC